VKGFSWVGIATDDFDRSMSFYRDVLGLDVWVEGDRQAILKTASGDQLEIFGRDEREKEIARSRSSPLKSTISKQHAKSYARLVSNSSAKRAAGTASAGNISAVPTATSSRSKALRDRRLPLFVASLTVAR
jgi:catechol 2,3-dioxygenase-like lactoylglutathione lyase family enzyme